MPDQDPHKPLNAVAPVSAIPGDVPTLRDPSKIALCLSGGGYRAMLFHLGTLWRLNELGYLGKLDRISSVSGGSITSGVLAAHWSELGVAPDTGSPKFSIVALVLSVGLTPKAWDRSRRIANASTSLASRATLSANG